MHTHSELPTLRATVRLQGDANSEPIEFFDVKFYPYTRPGEDPVFAVVGGRHTFICRCVPNDDSAVQTLRHFEDEQKETINGDPLIYNSVEWSQAENGDPLVCVAGTSQIKILNVITGDLVTTLVGHGMDIHDLAISPQDPTILASSSADHSVRIWSLDPAHTKQPTAAICFGQGHKDQILTIAYHRKGQYILSGGMDTRVNLWRIPDDLSKHVGTDKPAMVHYPHFSTTELHTDFVDCVRWYNDIIISHAAREDVIQLWKIDGFDSEESPPDTAPIPASTAVNSLSRVSVAASSVPGTRSAWGGRFQRLLQFDLPDHVRFYVRFSLFHELGAHPVLVAGNEKSKMFFWDLQHVEGLGIGDNGAPDSKEKDKKVLPHHFRDGSVASTNSGTSGQHSRSTSAFTKGKGKASAAKPNRGVGDPFHSVPQNQDIMVQKYEFPFRQFAWSRDGQWCVGVGGYSMITVLHRWEHGVPPPETSVSRKAG